MIKKNNDKFTFYIISNFNQIIAMKKIIQNRKFEIIGGIIGIIGGYLYWKYVGCISGTCPIQANWYSMVPYGLVFGILVGGLFKPKKKE